MHRTKPFYWWTSSFDWKLNLFHRKNNYEKEIIAIKGIIEMVVAQGSDLWRTIWNNDQMIRNSKKKKNSKSGRGCGERLHFDEA